MTKRSILLLATCLLLASSVWAQGPLHNNPFPVDAPFRVAEDGALMSTPADGPTKTSGDISSALVADTITGAIIRTASQAATLASVPTMPDLQKLTLANAIQKVEIAQLRLQQAVTEAQKLVNDAQRPGFVLDLPTLTYSPEKPIVPAPAKEDE